MTHRESTLRASLEPTLRRGVRCGRCGGSKQTLEDADGTGRRVWLDCSTCRGRGCLGTLGERSKFLRVIAPPEHQAHWLIPARWSRGFVSGITCTLEWWKQNGRQCVREWPLEVVECSDYPPTQGQSGLWYTLPNGDPPIPRELNQMLVDENGLYGRPTEADARAVVSEALLMWARGPEEPGPQEMTTA